MNWILSKIGLSGLLTIIGFVGVAGSLWAAKHFYDKSIEERLARESAEANVQYYAKNISQLNQEYQRGRNFDRRVTQPFEGHDLAKLAKAKPGMVEDRINHARNSDGGLFDLLEAEGQFTP